MTNHSEVGIYLRGISSKLEQIADQNSVLIEHLSKLLGENFKPNTVEKTPLLNVREAATYLKCCKGTLYRLHSTGVIKGYKTGKLVKFKKEDLDAYLEGEPSETNEDLIKQAMEHRVKNLK